MRPLATAAGLALALSAAPAGAVDMTGRLGLYYDQLSLAQPTGSGTYPRLSLDGNVLALGSLSEYGSWRGGVGYEALRRTFSDASTADNGWTFTGGLTLLDDRAPVSVSLSADRVAVDSSQTSGDTRITGTRVDEVYGGQVNVHGGQAMSLAVGGWLMDHATDGFATPQTIERSRVIEVGAQHGPGPYDVRLDYQGRWNSGTNDFLDYDQQQLNLNATARLGDAADVFASGYSYLRRPTTLSATNPDYDSNYLLAGIRTRSESTRGLYTYSYTHQVFSSPATGDRERLLQNVSGLYEIHHSSSFETAWTVAGALGQERDRGLQDETYGGSLAPLARWLSRTDAQDLIGEVGPVLGVLKPMGGTAEPGYGAHWGGHAVWRGGSRIGLDYTGDWGRNLNATQGWILTQSATGDLLRQIHTARAHLALVVATSRVSGSFLGDAATRDVHLTANLDWRRAGLLVDTGLRDATSPAVTGTMGDGLFVPAAFDSHTQYVTVGGSFAFTPRVVARASANWTRLSGPELAPQQEYLLTGVLEYRLGQLTLALQENYSAGGPGFDRRINEIMVRASRSFDTRY